MDVRHVTEKECQEWGRKFSADYSPRGGEIRPGIDPDEFDERVEFLDRGQAPIVMTTESERIERVDRGDRLLTRHFRDGCLLTDQSGNLISYGAIAVVEVRGGVALVLGILTVKTVAGAGPGDFVRLVVTARLSGIDDGVVCLRAESGNVQGQRCHEEGEL